MQLKYLTKYCLSVKIERIYSLITLSIHTIISEIIKTFSKKSKKNPLHFHFLSYSKIIK